MDRKIKERLELALRLVEKPTLEEVLEEVSRRGVLRGPVDWVFPVWMLYVKYATQKIAEAFQLSEEERRQLLDFRDALTRLLREAWMQAKEKLAALYKAVVRAHTEWRATSCMRRTGRGCILAKPCLFSFAMLAPRRVFPTC
jgi:hypothetical protein